MDLPFICCEGTRAEIFTRVVSILRQRDSLQDHVALQIVYSKYRAVGRYTHFLTTCDFRVDVIDSLLIKRHHLSPCLHKVQFRFCAGNKSCFFQLAHATNAKVGQLSRPHTKLHRDEFHEEEFLERISHQLSSAQIDVNLCGANAFASFITGLDYDEHITSSRYSTILVKMISCQEEEVLHQGLICLYHIYKSQITDETQARFFTDLLGKVTFKNTYRTLNLQLYLHRCLQLFGA